MTLSTLISNAISELKETWKESEYPEELVNEIADSSVPTYYNRIAELAQDDMSLMLDTPELGCCTGSNFIGKENSPISWIAANVYERLTQALHEALYELQTKAEEEELEAA